MGEGMNKRQKLAIIADAMEDIRTGQEYSCNALLFAAGYRQGKCGINPPIVQEYQSLFTNSGGPEEPYMGAWVTHCAGIEAGCGPAEFRLNLLAMYYAIVEAGDA